MSYAHIFVHPGAMERRKHCVIISSLLWIILVRSFDPSLSYFNSSLSHSEELYDNILNIVTIFFFIFLPIFGLLTDIKFGWINAATISTCIGALCSLFSIVISLALRDKENVVALVTSVSIPLAQLARIYFEVSIFCFGTEELIEMAAGSDSLSSYIWWRSWCTNLGTMITVGSSCLFYSHKNYKIYSSSFHFILLVLIIVTALVIKRWALKHGDSANPLKLIFGVLCFAFKNKYPLNRSALTYWEKAPSRINFGKTKYGGPFLEKDVESVKTLFRLLPLIAVITMIEFPYQTLSVKKMTPKQCLVYGSYFIENCVAIVTVPIYQFIIKPFCIQRMRLTMLKRIIIGIALTVFGKLGFVVLDLYISIPAYLNYKETICLLQSAENNTSEYIDDFYLYFQLLPSCINSVGVLLVIAGSFEFVFAQAPRSMRGLLIRIWFSITGIYEVAGWMMVKPFKAASEYLIPSCELYVLLMNFLVMLASLIMSMLCSQRYRLHSNEDVFNPHLIAEIYYEKQFNQRDKLISYDSLSASVNSN